jgi:DNA-binding response OmpR family regulator
MEKRLTLLAVALDLAPLQARMLDHMMRNPISTIADLSAMTGGHVQTYVYRLRTRLRNTGIKIDSRYGVGYSLSAETRQVIATKLEEYLALASVSA